MSESSKIRELCGSVSKHHQCTSIPTRGKKALVSVYEEAYLICIILEMVQQHFHGFIITCVFVHVCASTCCDPSTRVRGCFWVLVSSIHIVSGRVSSWLISFWRLSHSCLPSHWRGRGHQVTERQCCGWLYVTYGDSISGSLHCVLSTLPAELPLQLL